jgi:AmmeMemoRadiSam system protein A
MNSEHHYLEVERRFMLDLARRTLVSVVAGGLLPEPAVQELSTSLTEKRACFVTLTEDGVLRGCIGHVLPRSPLYQAVMESAEGAALHDPRFAPVCVDEVSRLRIEISVLTQPQAIDFSSPEELLAQLQPRQHGVVLKVANHSATFLPQVWEHIPDKTEFLNRLSEKAGFERSGWRGEDVTVSVYRVECFEEGEVEEDR